MNNFDVKLHDVKLLYIDNNENKKLLFVVVNFLKCVISRFFQLLSFRHFAFYKVV